jgi:hypothetical protein
MATLVRHSDYRSTVFFFETGPEGPELEGLQVEKKSKAAQTKPKKLIRRTCPSGHGMEVMVAVQSAEQFVLNASIIRSNDKPYLIPKETRY